MIDQPNPLYVDFHLLDRQIVDRDGLMIGNVDDVELELDDGVPVVTALLVGQRVLGQRIGGLIGRWLDSLACRLSATPDPPPIRIPYDDVAAVGSEIRLRVTRDQVAEPPLETWLREHVIERLPGSHHADE